MDVRLAYGSDGLDLVIPDKAVVDRHGLSAVKKPLAYADFVERFERTGGDALLAEELLAAGETPLIVVNDGHRSTPTPRVLEWLDQYAPGLLDQASILIAGGAHSQPEPQHLERIFGPYLERVVERVVWHDCRDLDAMTELGKDHFGETVYINRLAYDAKRLLVVTSVEPHYFAGFTGGRKSFFPGLTDRATIERNHNLANSLDCAPLRVIDNPMAKHLDEMLDMFNQDKVFSIQLVADAGYRVSEVFCGPIRQAFIEATVASESLYAHPIEQPYDLVLAEVRPPLDHSLYQIQKALENCQVGVKDGGTIVVVAACQDGIGKRAFFDLAAEWDRDKNAPQDGTPRFGSHKLSRVLAMTRRINVRLYSELPDDQPRRVFYEPVADPQALIDELMQTNDSNRLAIVHDAGHTVLKPIDAT